MTINEIHVLAVLLMAQCVSGARGRVWSAVGGGEHEEVGRFVV